MLFWSYLLHHRRIFPKRLGFQKNSSFGICQPKITVYGLVSTHDICFDLHSGVSSMLITNVSFNTTAVGWRGVYSIPIGT